MTRQAWGGCRASFAKLFQNIIERKIKKYQLWNMDETGFIKKQSSRKVVVSKGSSNMWSKCADTNFHMKFSVCVSSDKYVAPLLLIISGERFNMDVLEGCDIEGDNITTSAKVFINYTLSLIWIEVFDNYVPDSCLRPLVLVYDGCCSHYNYIIVKNKFILN